MRAIAWLLLLLGGLAIGLMVWEPLTAARATPPPAMPRDVEIVRDRFGVPHIFGRTDADTAYGLAYAHAEDDFDTLQEVLAMSRGRLGALNGAEGAETDYVAALLDVEGTVARKYDVQPADVRALLDGYAAGLNRYAETHPGEVRLARLFPIEGRDIARGFVLRSPFFFGLDSVLEALVKGEDPPPQQARFAPLPDAPSITPAGPAALEKGSNAFAIAPRRSADGATRLVSNSHQPWRGGVAWYEAVTHSQQGLHFAGALFPGMPMLAMGHNRVLGWTNTVNRADLIDVYKLVLDEAGESYRFDGAWRTLETRRVWLKVRFGPFVLPLPQTVRRSVHGPVIVNKQGAFAIRYAQPDDLRNIEQYYRLTKARNWEEWSRVMAMQAVPATNFIYGDASGRIALVYNAAFPNRRPGFDYAKVLRGDISANLTPGTVPWRAIPQLVDPPSGYIQNANNTPWVTAGPGSELTPSAWPPLLGIESDMTNRAQRAIELLEADRQITAEEIEVIKFDTAVSRASWARPWFASIDRIQVGGRLARAQALLRRWDWNFDGRGPADTLAALLMRAGNRGHYRRRPFDDPKTELAIAAGFLLHHYGRLDVPLGQALRLRQGAVDLPLDGGPDVLRAMPLWDVADDGRLAARHGDSFTMFVEWDRQGRVRSKSIQPFGSATTRPASPHYADQARLFAGKRFKSVLFEPAALRGQVERRYRP